MAGGLRKEKNVIFRAAMILHYITNYKGILFSILINSRLYFKKSLTGSKAKISKVVFNP